tara:strand:+ start:140 stop:1879 length:1740 start_codon:yes stop_codon:yes gene_type:complete
VWYRLSVCWWSRATQGSVQQIIAQSNAFYTMRIRKFDISPTALRWRRAVHSANRFVLALSYVCSLLVTNPGSKQRGPKSTGDTRVSKPTATSSVPPVTCERYGDPTLPPNVGKKRAYWLWFGFIFVLEFCLIRKATQELNPFSYDALWNPFLLRTQLLNVATHVVIDLGTLRSLNALTPHGGLSFPARLHGAPVLNTSEENTVLWRHLLKLVQRNPVVNGLLLGAKPDGFHAYELKQILMMILSPTFFGVLFAVKSTEGLFKMGVINLGFVVAHTLLMPFAFKYTDKYRGHYEEKIGPEGVWRRNFAVAGAVVAAAPFVASIVVRVMKWEWRAEAVLHDDAQARRALVMAKNLEKLKRSTAAQIHDDEHRSRDGHKVRGLRLDGGTELSVSSLCFTNGTAQYVVVRETLFGVVPRVFFDGRLLRSSSEPTVCPTTGDTHTVLKVYPPEWLDLARGRKPVGRAWVVTGRKTQQNMNESGFTRGLSGLRQTKSPSHHQPWNDDSFAQVGEAVPLLFLDDPEVTREVNAVVSLIRNKMDGVKANRLVMRLGNCITYATFNPSDMEAMTKVVATMGMKVRPKP